MGKRGAKREERRGASWSGFSSSLFAPGYSLVRVDVGVQRGGIGIRCGLRERVRLLDLRLDLGVEPAPAGVVELTVRPHPLGEELDRIAPAGDRKSVVEG